MKQTLDDLLAIVHRFHPRGIGPFDARYGDTEENRRLVAARRQAGGEERYEVWRGLLGRLRERLPGHEITDRSFHLAGGTLDACYSAKVSLRPVAAERDRELGILVSFLVPAYVLYRSCFFAGDKTRPIEERAPRQDFGHDFAEHERPIARAVAEEIERTFPGCEPMPPALGEVQVTDVNIGWSDVAPRLYDLLFMNEW